MGTELDKIKQTMQYLQDFTDTLKRLLSFAKALKDKQLSIALRELVKEYAKVNFKFSALLINKTLEAYTLDKIQKEKNEE